MTTEHRLAGFTRVYCDRCGLLMSNGFCLHGSVQETLEQAYRDGATFGGEVVIDRFITATRSR